MTSEILTSTSASLAHITLNRPQALHALNTAMCAAMIDALVAWRDDASILAILLDHAPGTRGFCAGGDIRMIAESGAGDGEAAREFFFTEYRLNHRSSPRAPAPIAAPPVSTFAPNAPAGTRMGGLMISGHARSVLD